MMEGKKKQAETFRMYAIASLGSAAVGFVAMGNPMGAVIGAAVGLALPKVLGNLKDRQRKKKFSMLLIDGIMLMVSCLKAGLSLTQAIEVLVKEMPDPLSTEFQEVLKALRIGVTLDDAFADMADRIGGEDLNLLFSAMLVARDTGGDLPKVLTRLVDTLRDRNKLKENVATYTIQGRIQGLIMGAIPILFCYVVLKQDPKHFEIMFQTEIGKMMLMAAAGLQVIAVYAIMKLSDVKI